MNTNINTIISQILSNNQLTQSTPILQHLNFFSKLEDQNTFTEDTYNTIIQNFLNSSQYQLILSTPQYIIYYHKKTEDIYLTTTSTTYSLTTGEILQ